MDRYKTGRILARTIGVIGWFIAAICAFFFIYRLIGTPPSMWAASFALLAMAGGALSLVLLSLVALAVFDMASMQAGRDA